MDLIELLRGFVKVNVVLSFAKFANFVNKAKLKFEQAFKAV